MSRQLWWTIVHGSSPSQTPQVIVMEQSYMCANSGLGSLSKVTPGNNSDIDNESNPDHMLLRMLSESLQVRFQHNFADQLLKQCIAHKNSLNHEWKTFTYVSNQDSESANYYCGLHWCLNAAACDILTQKTISAMHFP